VICTPSINVRKKILDYTNEELDRVLKVNISGNFNVLRTAGRIMVAQKRGSGFEDSTARLQRPLPDDSTVCGGGIAH
jgi:NAD(P)-dependent dehydrogenase (short-subunit alcohol dehydrogenase family)